MELVSKSQAETTQRAQDYIANLVPVAGRATVLGLAGDLGSGKTTFTQSLARSLGISEAVTSPTFVLEKIYKLVGQKWQKLIHIDAYRLESGQELLKLGFSELLADQNNLIVVEWPERVSEALGGFKKINFKFVDENTREINFT